MENACSTWPSFLCAVSELGWQSPWEAHGLSHKGGHRKTRDSPGFLASRLSQMLPVWLGGRMDDGHDTSDKNMRLVSGADE